MSQLDLFASSRHQTACVAPVDPNVIPTDAKRLAGQNAKILARLREGPATNSELAAISLKYTSRLSDVRAAGYRVTCERKSRGLSVYRLVDA